MALGDVALDPGAAFMSGNATSAFVKMGAQYAAASVLASNTNLGTAVYAADQLSSAADNAVNGANAVVDKTLNTAAGLVDVAQMALMDIPQIMQEVQNKIMNAVNTIVSNAIVEITSVPNPADILKEAQSIFNSEKTSISKELQKLQKSAESLSEEKLELAAKKEESNGINKLAGLASSLNGGVTKITGDISSKLDSIMSYAEQGPDWVHSQVTNFIDSKTREATNFVDKQLKFARDAKQELVQKMARGMANKMLQAYNPVIEKQALVQMAKINKAKEKATVMAKAQSQAAILQLKAKLGA